jgi:CBS domain-containing protein
MPQAVREVMNGNVVTLPPSAPLVDAARRMRDADIGDVLVVDGGTLAGVVTDRDIVVRAIADGKDPQSTTLADVCSGDVVTVAPDDSIDHAAQVMRERAVRRVPVVDGRNPVGIVSLGDVAIERESSTPLADISAAKGNT